MNDVARWAKDRGPMDHTGNECVPRQVSLLEAHVNQPARVALLQHHDGYGPQLEVGAELPVSYQRPAAEIESLLAGIPVLAVLAADERRGLARSARPLTLGPTERLVVQGEPGGSLFVIADGELEVMLRGDDGAQQYAPILRAHPELVDVLARLMADRLAERRARLDARAADRERAAIARRIRSALRLSRA